MNAGLARLVLLSVVALVLITGRFALAQAVDENLLEFRPPEVIAVDNGDYKALKSLLIGGSNPNTADGDGRSLLMAAAALDDLDMIEMVLDYNPQLDSRDKTGRTALHWAVRAGATDAAVLLLERGLYIDARTDQGLTPLMMAIRESDRYLVRELLAAGPDFTISDYTGRTALDWARTARDKGIAPLLEAAGAQQ